MSYRGVRLKTLSDLRRFVANTVNKVHKDEMQPDKAKVLNSLCRTLCDIIKDSELEQRVLELEKNMEAK